jgi:hypothetical protein
LTAAGARPVAGAWVGWEPVALSHSIVAEAITGAAGHFLLCGLPEGSISGLFATMSGYAVTTMSVGPGGDLALDIEIQRCTTAPIEPGEGIGCAP